MRGLILKLQDQQEQSSASPSPGFLRKQINTPRKLDSQSTLIFSRVSVSEAIAMAGSAKAIRRCPMLDRKTQGLAGYASTVDYDLLKKSSKVSYTPYLVTLLLERPGIATAYTGEQVKSFLDLAINDSFVAIVRKEELAICVESAATKPPSNCWAFPASG
ncbi:uncharacterized protein BDR25DRAFT_348566 [Lindgomyces ingoldianus]|uniref:Uncharacterized protein n=1 Tax=Lindgomyces ingoldianus TaxID=673940 RepID=A0ACB6RGQ4_9PLEO|nr:uncharacterized protein BDR25DRAFT_348566 [Lindgomyces ingoldianus]KAF2478307.1 hypothetical protein BDR25DRAFT_348566 [Lindgomyces ingoldianus]